VETSRKGWRRAVAAIALGALATACAAARPVHREGPEPYRFKIDRAPDGKTCTVEVDFRNCNPLLKPNDPAQPKDCVRALGGQDVVFVSGVGEFEVFFDPFGKTTIRSEGGTIPKLTLLKPTRSGPKPYTFWVRPKDCPPIDPEIIVDR
jgi:hypothetical protein